MRGSSPSATVSGKARPLTVTTTSAISALLGEDLADLGKRRLDASEDLGRGLLDLGGLRGALGLEPRRCIAVAELRRCFKSQHRALQLHEGVVELAHACNLCRAPRGASTH